MLCNSPDKTVHCPPGLLDSESLDDGDMIYGSWQNDTPGESMYPIQCLIRVHNCSVSVKAVQDAYSEHFFNEGAVLW